MMRKISKLSFDFPVTLEQFIMIGLPRIRTIKQAEDALRYIKLNCPTYYKKLCDAKDEYNKSFAIFEHKLLYGTGDVVPKGIV